MTEPEQPATPPLTRKQLREIRNTGANPIVTTAAIDAAAAGGQQEAVAVEEPAPSDDTTAETAEPTPVAPLPRAAEPAVVAERPAPDASVDLGASPLTRRQARQQERIRTASVPVITPDLVAAHASAVGAAQKAAARPVLEAERPADRPSEGVTTEADDQKVEAEETWLGEGGAPAPREDDDDRAGEEPEAERVVNPALGADLLAGDAAPVELPPSFDQLLSRSSAGSTSTPNALIVSQAPAAAPLVAPITSTGDVLITGTFNLPEGLGSTGHALGTADGKEVDAVLVDGELPAHSSPTPIAASAAISTSKSAGDIIKPPAPEKGSRLMLTLAITAGALALALVGVLILAFVTGVFA
jgi:hypothetical protein